METPALDPVLFGNLTDMLADMGDDVLSEVLELYLVDAPPRVSELRSLDDAGLRRAAHTLRGSACSIGAARLARLCEVIEDAPYDTDLTPMIGEIEAEMARVVREVQGELERAA